MKSYKLIKYYIAPYKKDIVWGIIFTIISVFFVMLLPQITQLFIDSVYTFSSTNNGNLGVLWYWLISLFSDISTVDIVLLLSIAYVLCLIIKNLADWGSVCRFFHCSSESCGNIRKDCFKKLAFANKDISTNEIFFNMTNDIDEFYNMVYVYFPKLLSYSLLILFASIFCFIINWKISLTFIIFVPIILWMGYIINLRTTEIFTESRNKHSIMIKVSEELINQTREIKTFANEDWAVSKFDKYNKNHTQITKKSNNVMNKSILLLDILRCIGIVMAVIFSAYACFTGRISVGYFVLIISYAFTIMNGSVNLISHYCDFNVKLIGVNRLTNFLNANFGIKEDKSLILKNPSIEFKNVELELNSNTIFDNLNFKLEYGKYYAIKIPQGKGKTALARLFLRFVSKQNGEILFNDIPYENYDINSLRRQFSYVTQEPFIFEGTIADNITMFERQNLDKLKQIIKVCELTRLVKKSKKKCRQMIVENGVNLTTQDCQKINIARALYKDAPVLLLDSSFKKFLPTATERILKRIIRLYKGKTIIYLTSGKRYLKLFDEVIDLGNLQKGGKK